MHDTINYITNVIATNQIISVIAFAFFACDVSTCARENCQIVDKFINMLLEKPMPSQEGYDFDEFTPLQLQTNAVT